MKAKTCEVCGGEHTRRGVTCSGICASELRQRGRLKAEGYSVCAFAPCGELFVPRHFNSKFCQKIHFNTCEACGKEYRVKSLSRPGKACSQACASKLSHTDAAKARRKENSLKKWGAETPIQAEAVKAKIKKKAALKIERKAIVFYASDPCRTQGEVAKLLGMSRAALQRYCYKEGIGWTYDPKEKARLLAKEESQEKAPRGAGPSAGESLVILRNKRLSLGELFPLAHDEAVSKAEATKLLGVNINNLNGEVERHGLAWASTQVDRLLICSWDEFQEQALSPRVRRDTTKKELRVSTKGIISACKVLGIAWVRKPLREALYGVALEDTHVRNVFLPGEEERFVFQCSPEETRQAGIYKIVTTSGRTYVGMTTMTFHKRWSEHITMMKKGRSKSVPLQRAYAKGYGFEFSILEVLPQEGLSREEAIAQALEREIFWWEKLESEGASLYNGRPTPGGSVAHTKEVRQRISEAKRLNLSQGERLKLQEAYESGEGVALLAERFGISKERILRAIALYSWEPKA